MEIIIQLQCRYHDVFWNVHAILSQYTGDLFRETL